MNKFWREGGPVNNWLPWSSIGDREADSKVDQSHISILKVDTPPLLIALLLMLKSLQYNPFCLVGSLDDAQEKQNTTTAKYQAVRTASF